MNCLGINHIPTWFIYTLKIDKTRFFRMLVTTYQTTRCYDPEEKKFAAMKTSHYFYLTFFILFLLLSEYYPYHSSLRHPQSILFPEGGKPNYTSIYNNG
jgi:hypothetical protein